MKKQPMTGQFSNKQLTQKQLAQKKLMRKPEVEKIFALSRSSFRDRMLAGLMTTPVEICGGRAVGWPSDEIYILYLMYVAGAPKDEIRELVRRLMEARTLAVFNII